jgi:hypothetical protein
MTSPIDDPSLRSTAQAADAADAGFDALREEGRRRRCLWSIVVGDLTMGRAREDQSDGSSS